MDIATSNPSSLPFQPFNAFLSGLLENGQFSDVEIQIFDTTYKLHRLLLQRCPYFRCLINWDNSDNTSDDGSIKLVDNPNVFNIEIDDPLITKECFELVLKRLYGAQTSHDALIEKQKAPNMIPTALFFQMEDIQESMLKKWNSKDLSMEVVIQILKLLDKRDLGDYGHKLNSNCLNYLYENGWQAGCEAWSGIRPSIVLKVVNHVHFFVPNDFERIMFAAQVLQVSNANEELIGLAIDDFRRAFSFFTLTYKQQTQLLKMKLPNGECIFDRSSLDNANMLIAHIQYSTMIDKTSPIPDKSSQLPDSCEFEKYFYEVKTPESDYFKKTTIIPPFRISLVLDMNFFTSRLSYYQGFTYCGSTWMISLDGYSNGSLHVEVDRISVSYSIESSEIRYSKPRSNKMKPVRSMLDECKVPELHLSDDVFQTQAIFHDWRRSTPVYFMYSFAYDGQIDHRKILGKVEETLKSGSSNIWTVSIPSDYLGQLRKKTGESLKFNIVFGVI
ncbi:unnamed protein product [Ambrosiozyma monospora]|uniref:Unnamed protein product n=1 Tax=Ambrosiozyma monospora TaxID=43982 RepID=A0A9W7DHZ0_AMBMO|nr:unnamed protein product [Ambrosiozyma monospora]